MEICYYSKLVEKFEPLDKSGADAAGKSAKEVVVKDVKPISHLRMDGDRESF